MTWEDQTASRHTDEEHATLRAAGFSFSRVSGTWTADFRVYLFKDWAPVGPCRWQGTFQRLVYQEWGGFNRGPSTSTPSFGDVDSLLLWLRLEDVL